MAVRKFKIQVFSHADLGIKLLGRIQIVCAYESLKTFLKESAAAGSLTLERLAKEPFGKEGAGGQKRDQNSTGHGSALKEGERR